MSEEQDSARWAGRPERRAPFLLDEAKFSTQRLVTYVILLIFSAVVTNVLIHEDQAERSTIIQTVINFAMLAIGFWLGASKQAQDHAAVASRIVEAKSIQAEDVKVQTSGDVMVNKQ